MLTIAPFPTNQPETQNADRDSNQGFNVTLYNTDGQELLKGASRDGKITLDTSSLTEGLYNLLIEKDGQIQKRQAAIIRQ